MPILELQEIKKTYTKGDNEVHALKGVNLSIEKGEFLSIMGPSGSGKTTLLNIVGCLDKPTSGTVIYNGDTLHAKNEKELSNYRKDNIGFIFQSYNLIPVLTVLENVELPMILEKNLSKAIMRERAMKILKSVGIVDKANKYPKELSGGQEQRVSIARALVKEPIVVLADEPTANLDSNTAEEVIDIMKEINNNLNTTFIFSTHDPRVEQHAKRIVIIKDGIIDQDNRR